MYQFYSRNKFTCLTIIVLLFATLSCLWFAFHHIRRQYTFKSMKILFVLNRFPTASETFVLDQITKLIDRGHEVFIYAFKKKKPEWCRDIVHQDVYRYGLLDRTFYEDIPENLSSFDIIYCQFGTIGADFLQFKEKFAPYAKMVTCFHGFDASAHVRENPGVYNELFKRCDLILSACNYFKNRLISLGCDTKKIVVHHMTIDHNKFPFKKRSLKSGESIQIVSVNRFVEKKGIKYAIHAVAQLLKKYPNIKYTIAGDGVLRQELSKLINKLGIQDSVTMLGAIQRDKVVQLLDNSHIFLLSSVTAANGDQESIPMVLKEAIAMGLPVVSTYHSGIPELIEDGISGFLAPERDVKILVEKIDYLITHPEKWASLSLAARKKVKTEFDLDNAIDKLENMFLDLLQKETY